MFPEISRVLLKVNNKPISALNMLKLYSEGWIPDKV